MPALREPRAGIGVRPPEWRCYPASVTRFTLPDPTVRTSTTSSGFGRYLDRLRSGRLSAAVEAMLREEGDPTGAGRLDTARLLSRLHAAADAGASRTWWITGAPGSGKSTLISELGVGLLELGVASVRLDAADEPVLRTLPDEPRALARALRPPEVDEALWNARVKRGALVIFLDGVDDVPGGADGSSARLPAPLAHARLPFPLVVASRSAPPSGPPGRAAHYSLLPWSDRQVARALQDRGLPPDTSITAIAAAGLDGLTGNPFHVALLAGHLAAGRSLPHTLAGLLLGALAGVPTPDAETASYLRCALARFDTVRAAVAGDLPAAAWNADAVGTLCATWVGLHANPDLAAEVVLQGAVARQRDHLLAGVASANAGALSAKVLARCWRAAGRALLGGREAREAAVRTLEALPDRALWRALSAGVLGSLEARDVAVYRVVRGGLLHRTLTASRLQALHADPPVEAPMGLPRDLDPLAEAIGQLRRATGSWRRAAANALGHIGAEGAVDALIQVLEPGAEPDPKVRGSATNALGQIGDRRAVAALISVLDPARESEERVRASAASALGRIGDRVAVAPLVAVASGETAEARVRGAAATALGLLADARATLVLTRLLDPAAEPDPRVRASAAVALGRVGCESAAALRQALAPGAEPDPRVRAAAAAALGEGQDPEAIPTLTRLLDAAREADPFVRAAAANALGQVGDASAVNGLSRVLTPAVEPEQAVRGSVANALGRIGHRSAVPALSAVLRPGAEPDAVVRASAARALGLVSDRTAVEALLGVLADGPELDAFVQEAAVGALGAIGDPAALPALTRLVESASTAEPDLRASAAAALASIGDTSATRALARALSTATAPPLRAALADALTDLGAPEPLTAPPGLRSRGELARGVPPRGVRGEP